MEADKAAGPETAQRPAVVQLHRTDSYSRTDTITVPASIGTVASLSGKATARACSHGSHGGKCRRQMATATARPVRSYARRAPAHPRRFNSGTMFS